MLRGVTSTATALLVVLSLTSDLGSGEVDSSASTVDLVSSRPGPSVHSSDGLRGPGLPAAGSARLEGPPAPAEPAAWSVAPGLDYASWTRTEPQGPVRVHLLIAHLDQPGLVLDQVSGPLVTTRHPLSRLLRADRAIAGVNGDFFDIADTGAPLGVGVDRQRGGLHAPRGGWNASFVVDRAGTPRVLSDRLLARVVRRNARPVTVTNHNSPLIARGGVGLYTPAWGRTGGRRVVDGARRVRQVVVRDGIVRSNRRRLARGTRINGVVLVGRERGADRLRGMKVGRRVRIESRLSTPARVAISGSVQLLRNGLVTTLDNVELHPRTAIGIDREQRLLHLVVVDGRSRASRGQTLRQLAVLMRSLGDEEALNLDGGGSSTMVARDTVGVVGVQNRPSDGAERPVPNGLGFRYVGPVG